MSFRFIALSLFVLPIHCWIQGIFTFYSTSCTLPGRVLEIVQNGDTPAMFVVVADGKVYFIYIKRADPFRVTPAEMEAENRDVLAMVRSLPHSADIIREFWPYSKYGSLRFFRVEDDWLLEIGSDGKPLAEKVAKPRVVKSDGKGSD